MASLSLKDFVILTYRLLPRLFETYSFNNILTNQHYIGSYMSAHNLFIGKSEKMRGLLSFPRLLRNEFNISI